MTAPPAGSRAVDVLIAEDDALMRRSLRTLLETEGYRWRGGGRRPNRRGDGPAFAAAVRHPGPRDAGDGRLHGGPPACADPRTRGIHIHCLTGSTDSSARKQAEQAGFETYMTKPVDPSQLLGVIRRK